MERTTDGSGRRDRAVMRFLLALSLVAFAIPLLLGKGPRGWGSEGGPVTFASAANLLACAAILAAIHRRRAAAEGVGGAAGRLLHPTAIWAAMALGFAYLAVDDLLSLHERIDKGLHRLLGVAETAATDSLDDLIVAGYIAVGLLLMWRHRREVARAGRTILLLAPGLVAALAMVAADVATERELVLDRLLSAPAADRVYPFLAAAEEVAKIAASLLFAAAFLRIRRRLAADDARGATEDRVGPPERSADGAAPSTPASSWSRASAVAMPRPNRSASRTRASRRRPVMWRF